MRGSDVPTRIERDGSTPCARANASGSPGSGGRHQQARRAAARADTARSRPARRARPRGGPTLGERRPSRRRGSSRRPGEVRSGRAPRARASQPGCANAAAATKTPAAPRRDDGARSNGTVLHAGESLVGRRRLELAERAHLGGRREHARLTPCQLPQLLGRRQRAEALEQPLDEVDLRLRERRVEPDAASSGPDAGSPPRSRSSARRG